MSFGLRPFLIIIRRIVSVLCQDSPCGFAEEYSDDYDNEYARCDYEPSNADDNYD